MISKRIKKYAWWGKSINDWIINRFKEDAKLNLFFHRQIKKYK